MSSWKYDNYPPGVTGGEWQITGSKPPRHMVSKERLPKCHYIVSDCSFRKLKGLRGFVCGSPDECLFKGKPK